MNRYALDSLAERMDQRRLAGEVVEPITYLTQLASLEIEKRHENGVRARVALARVIKMYSDIVTFFGSGDPVSRRLFEEILGDEEDHADEIADLLFTIDPISGNTVERFDGDSMFVPFGA